MSETIMPCAPPSVVDESPPNSHHSTVASAHDLKRLRELFKYFSSTSKAFGYSDTDIDSSDYDASKARLSSDPVFNSLAQLAAWRLSCDRAFISLIDSEHQYVIAESTRRISLYNADDHPPNEGICVGARPLDLVSGVCAGTMPAFLETDIDGPYYSSSNIFADKTRYIINDFTLEQKYKDRPYVTGFPFMRYYAEVPIKSPIGHVLGTLAVVDNKPRCGLDEKDFLILTEIASTVMNHIQKIKTEQDHMRASRLLEGLNNFVQGKYDNEKSYHRETYATTSKSPVVLEKVHDLSGDLPERRSPSKTPAVDSSNLSPSLDESSRQSPSANLETAMLDSSNPQTSLQRILNTGNTSILPSDSPNVDNDRSTTSQEPSGRPAQTGPEDKIEGLHGTRLRDFLISNEIRGTFSNASHLLRQAMDLDGVIFLDAALSDFASRNVAHASPVNFSQSSKSAPDPLSSESDEDELSQPSTNPSLMSETNPTVGSRFERQELLKQHQSTAGDIRMSGRLGYAIKNEADENENVIFSEHFSLPEVVHLSLLHRYPKGHIFDFDQNATELERQSNTKRVNVRPDDKIFKSRRKLLKRRQINVALQQAFPKISAAIFVPLWNPHKESWFAGGIGWLVADKRVLQQRDLGYFTIFGNSIMADVTRLELIASDRAKSNFISSISHELRSPLHGILGSAELLRDAAKTSSESQMISMVENCGRTMLDTMDHILDFAKISTTARAGNIYSKDYGKKPDTDMNAAGSSESLFHLDKIIEDTVQSLVAGYQYKSASVNRLSDLTQPHDYAAIVRKEASISKTSVEKSSIVVIIDVDKQITWRVQSEIAAWRRIILNLVGNALKYTNEGLIEIELRVTGEDATQAVDRRTPRFATLKVRDTGFGIGKAYLRTHLYTPFIQENDLSEGTGLGLSIIQKVVQRLGGNMDVQSELGVGTEVEVILPLKVVSAAPIPIATPQQEAIICLLGFNIYPDLSATPTGVLSRVEKSKIALKNIFEKYAKDWLGLNVISAADAISTKADVYVICDTDSHLLFTGDDAGLPLLSIPNGSSLIVVSTAIENQLGDTASLSGRFQYLTQPVGPHKTIETIETALEASREEAATASTLNSLFADESKDRFQSKHLPINRAVITHSSVEPAQFYGKTGTDISEHQPGPPSADRKPTFLLVDDNEINLKLLIACMKKLSCEYMCATNGQEAVDTYERANNAIDYILMDVSMPVMDGFAATRAIRQFENTGGLPATPIIALTGLGSATAQQEAFTSGVNFFLMKPVPMKVIRALMEQGLSALE